MAFGLTIAVLGQVDLFVTDLGGPREYVATASFVLVVYALAAIVVYALAAIVGDAEGRRFQTTVVERCGRMSASRTLR